MEKQLTLLDLYSFLEEQYSQQFLHVNVANLKFFVPSLNSYLDINQTTLESVLGKNYVCKFQLKEYVQGQRSSDFSNSNQLSNKLSGKLFQAQQQPQQPQQQQQQQQQQVNNNFQVQNPLKQITSQQQQQVSQNQQYFPQPHNQFNQQNYQQPPIQQIKQFNPQVQYQNPPPQVQYQNPPPPQVQYQNPPPQVQYQNQPPQLKQIKITLRYKQNTVELEVDTDLTLDELLANVFSIFEINGQIEMFCQNISLSKINHNTTIIQAGIKNDSIIECKELDSVISTNKNQDNGQFYQKMKFEQVPQQNNQQAQGPQYNQQQLQQNTQQVQAPLYNQQYPQKNTQQAQAPLYNQQQVQQNNPQQLQQNNQKQTQTQQQNSQPILNFNSNDPSNQITVNFEIIDGAISRRYSMQTSTFSKLDQLIDSVLTYLTITREIASIELFHGKIALRGDKLNLSLQQLQMTQNPLEIKAKVVYCGGYIKGI